MSARNIWRKLDTAKFFAVIVTGELLWRRGDGLVVRNKLGKVPHSDLSRTTFYLLRGYYGTTLLLFQEFNLN